MTETTDQLIQARFEAVANPSVDGNWSDVLARARSAEPMASTSRMPRRLALAAAVVASAAVVTAVAFGLPQTLIDFFSSPQAPTGVKNWFGAQNVTAPPGMNPQAIPGQARKIATARFDMNSPRADHPTVHTLYVAPKKGGGFCFLWTNADGGCLTAKPPHTPAMQAIGPLAVSWSTNNDGPPLLVDGWVRTGATKTIAARFADGRTATIPFTSVSAPINAGFFVYTVPTTHRTRAQALRSIVALDASGNVVGRESFRLPSRLDQDVPQTLPDGTKVSLPRRADAAKARKIISFRATDGSPVYLWLMPRAGGGDCFVSNQTVGCRIPRFVNSEPAFGGGLSAGAHRVLFFGMAKPQVAWVVLRYQDGTSERLTPVDGFLLHEIRPAHYKRGTRLVSAVAFDRSGKRLLTQHYEPQAPAVYPCKKPVDRGYGAKSCP